jgi:serine/threonine protein phosphatase PrpC
MSVPATSLQRFTWRSASFTSKGNVRSHNEDSVLDLPEYGLWVVADGMGGHNAGDVASSMVVESLRSIGKHTRPSAFVDDVEERLRAVNERLYRVSIENNTGMSGTTVAALLAFEGYCVSLWAGDSRVYRSRDNAFTQITRDHSEIQEMLDEGVLTAQAAEQHGGSNVITRAVGGAQDLCLDLELHELRHNDRYLLCSDGLYKDLPEAQLARHVAGNDPEGACRALQKQALAGTCSDNVTSIVVQFSAV